MSEQMPDRVWIGYNGKDFTVSVTRQSLRVPYVTECSVELEKQKARGEEKSLAAQIADCMEFLIWLRQYEWTDELTKNRLTSLFEALARSAGKGEVCANEKSIRTTEPWDMPRSNIVDGRSGWDGER